MKDRYFSKKFLNLVLIVLILAGYQTVIHTRAQEEKIAELEYELDYTQDSSLTEGEQEAAVSYIDGTYTGEAEGFGGPVQVSVTVAEGQISSIEVTKADGEDSAYLETAMKIIDQMIEAQSTNVDTVSGATFSSGGIRDAAEQALEQAVAE